MPDDDDFEEDFRPFRERVAYFLFGWWYRWQAAKLAAQTIGNREEELRLVHSLAVFFETYMVKGANYTADFFGAEIINLNDARKSRDTTGPNDSA